MSSLIQPSVYEYLTKPYAIYPLFNLPPAVMWNGWLDNKENIVESHFNRTKCLSLLLIFWEYVWESRRCVSLEVLWSFPLPNASCAYFFTHQLGNESWSWYLNVCLLFSFLSLFFTLPSLSFFFSAVPFFSHSSSFTLFLKLFECFFPFCVFVFYLSRCSSFSCAFAVIVASFLVCFNACSPLFMHPS